MVGPELTGEERSGRASRGFVWTKCVPLDTPNSGVECFVYTLLGLGLVPQVPILIGHD